MKVNKVIQVSENHSIEIGQSTWNENSISIRNRYNQKNGRIDPKSSSEIPRNDIKTIIHESIRNDLLINSELLDIIENAVNKMKQNIK